VDVHSDHNTTHPNTHQQQAASMNKTDNSSRWFGAWRDAPQPEQDPADMGTAFGLEMTLEPQTMPSAAEPQDAPMGWIQRLANRGKPTL
jgi:hypothetical protein